MAKARVVPFARDSLAEIHTILESQRSANRRVFLDTAQTFLEESAHPYAECLRRVFFDALEAGDYGPLRAIAALADIPEDYKVMSEKVWRRFDQTTNDYLRLRRKDPTTIKALPRRRGAPVGDARLAGRILFGRGLSYRDVVLALWLLEAPISISDLRSEARREGGKYTDQGARDWLAGRGRAILVSVARAWLDACGGSTPVPGLSGFTRVSRYCLSEWPEHAFAGITQKVRIVNRRQTSQL